MNRVSGKVALVTGAASGIGASSARLLAEAGATVILADRNEKRGTLQAKEIQQQEGKAEFTS